MSEQLIMGDDKISLIEFGELRAEVRSLKVDIKTMEAKLDTITNLVEQGKGARLAINAIWWLAGILTSGALYVVSVIKGNAP